MIKKVIISFIVLAAAAEFFLGLKFYFPIFFKFLWYSNFGIIIITLLVGSFALILYYKQKRENKRDAARLILQEIRRAEDIISDYKQSGGYQFAKKIIATNSWGKSIHLFVGDLDNDELDRISNLYSTGEYLDTLIKEISDYTFKKEIGEKEGEVLRPSMMIPMVNQDIQQQGQTINPGVTQSVPQAIKFVNLKIEPSWKPRLDLITFKIEPIYHSTIALKLKKIARLI
ncbi:MAG: hypothetical protein V1845_00615 [bacterium]